MNTSKKNYYEMIYVQLITEFPDKPWITHISQLIEKKEIRLMCWVINL